MPPAKLGYTLPPNRTSLLGAAGSTRSLAVLDSVPRDGGILRRTRQTTQAVSAARNHQHSEGHASVGEWTHQRILSRS